MNKFDFNKWRLEYDSYGFEDHKKIYEELYVIYPDQQHYDMAALFSFIDYPYSKRLKILEIGGWKGELANGILNSNIVGKDGKRLSDQIAYWHNYEITPSVITNSVCNHNDYNVILAEDFVWNLNVFQEYNVCIMSHVAEHMKAVELGKFFEKINHIQHIYIHAPIQNESISWDNYVGTHILETGWDGIKEMLSDYCEQKHSDQIRFFRKDSGIYI
jgi:hypothetical protein